MKGVPRLVLALVVLAAGLMLAAPAAQAVSFDFTSDHCTGGCGTPPFGTVTLVDTGDDVQFTVQLNSPNAFVKTGSGDFQAFKFNATDVALTDITVAAHTPALAAAKAATPGGFDGDGTGEFNFGINCPTCANGAGGRFTDDIVFTVANAEISDFLTPNNLGQIFAADIISCTAAACSGFTGTNGTGNTGAIDVSSVAEPGSLLFAGSALVAAGMLGRRWKRRR